ncbi:MAG: type I 3-dehydroquinate dehydratase [Candidatus Diapherotrites archaeon]|uniref:Type I 3-dehydroquinate dehydratase n=1 Tax=Candidatus Iainarchaeum sp. TaxID=3101447 RepID=A0A8T3YJ79_9ARCH|nr:type I 3-dehydroquinate dehydratase [Candidatus Diapherotrites archaeon]
MLAVRIAPRDTNEALRSIAKASQIKGLGVVHVRVDRSNTLTERFLQPIIDRCHKNSKKVLISCLPDTFAVPGRAAGGFHGGSDEYYAVLSRALVLGADGIEVECFHQKGLMKQQLLTHEQLESLMEMARNKGVIGKRPQVLLSAHYSDSVPSDKDIGAKFSELAFFRPSAVKITVPDTMHEGKTRMAKLAEASEKAGTPLLAFGMRNDGLEYLLAAGKKALKGYTKLADLTLEGIRPGRNRLLNRSGTKPPFRAQKPGRNTKVR